MMSDSTRHYILATAGHVDHGKSSIVHALTGTDPDRLPEEKSRGITIDLGFAHLTLPPVAGAERAHNYEIGIIDVPGHEDFVKNMVCGAGAVDVALLVVAADDGWMPQTEEHLQILLYLGARRLVVALTKVDLISDEVAAADVARRHLRGTRFADAEIVPVSVPRGRGVSELREAIERCVADLPPQQDLGKPRLSADRVFSLAGVGTVVTGTLIGGKLRREQPVVVQPGATPSRVRGLQTARRAVDEAVQGSRVAIHLAAVACGKRAGERGTGILRGDVVAGAGVGVVTRQIDVLLERAGRDQRSSGSLTAGARLRPGVQVRLHHGSRRAIARLQLLDAREVLPGDRCIARLTLDRPMLLLVGDRALLRSASDLQTLCGGIVLDPSPPRGKRYRLRPDTAQAALLRARADAPESVEVAIATQVRRDGSAVRGDLLEVLNCSSAQLDETMTALVAPGALIEHRGEIVDALMWNQLVQEARTAVERHHRQHPEQQGLPIERLRIELSDYGRSHGFRSLSTSVIDGIMSVLCDDGFVRVGANIARSKHRIALPARLQAAGELCRRQLEQQPFDPPSRKELCKSDLAMQALRFLLASGEVVEVGPELVLTAEAFALAITLIRRHLASRGTSTVSELKSVLGSSRRVMVPLLERLDRDGITRRQGDLRTLAR